MTVLFWFTIGLWTRISSILSRRGRDLVRPPRSRGPVRARQADRHAHPLPGDRPLRKGAFGRLVAGPPPGQGQSAGTALSIAANFALRLIQIHMCIVYLFAGASKLQGTAWWNGQAMWMVFGNLEYQSVDMTWTAWHPWADRAAQPFHGVLGAFVLRVDLGARLLRPLVLFGCAFLHLGIGATMGLWTFSLAMLIGCSPRFCRLRLARPSVLFRPGRKTQPAKPAGHVEPRLVTAALVPFTTKRSDQLEKLSAPKSRCFCSPMPQMESNSFAVAGRCWQSSSSVRSQKIV